MLRYVVVSLFGGLLLGVLDGIINANPYAQKLFDVYKPISKTSVNIILGFGIDIFYGFVMAGLFLLLYKSLPGSTGLVKGITFGLITSFFSVLMHVFSQLMMFKVPLGTLVYVFLTGLFEMLVIGIIFGLTLK
ncbi:hypothetical protein A2434_01355 [Candidatus Woesebacteria bacterium RIFOXYC1_FULL_41_14]|uniref:Uncharacterized protein n=3 Tax=Candidatus Woeseibacteriota TaxID=1752722 RepID=A0A0G0QK84_9BACT|nr:MAG: hypothetical protein UT76_C0042G0008 [Candidatus Woesebacteria bacterium GW2011_GWB1_40_12]OGM81182.1 MAG: hypothetical protein A2393_01445 [Candidatus Woesebacteria bacterium RIFOXYB1_FULL_41_13]OGM84928.1 MAG: hypothetical protein A2434_01355 [Candidatus Woesebacteria bacterium RIFOXYC1_FULL_41_14]OGM88905.1 MAG: hypothetical protein A2594_02545 [Candidatus Woesebacteria bacterium RIFOXYD1_FULL_41_28]